MSSRLDQFQEIVLTFESPWNLAGKVTHNWSQSFYVSGTITHDDAAAEAAGLALAGPALGLASAQTSLVKITYYPSQSLVSTTNKLYAPGTHPGTAGLYNGIGNPQQLEVACVAHAPIGKNTRGKTIYLRKYFHDVLSEATDPNALKQLTAPATALDVFKNGAGPHGVVPVSPTSGKDGGDLWTLETHLFTHQLRKGKKKKKPGAGTLAVIEHLVADATDLTTLKDLVKAVS